jgi:hypothetical protein
MQQSKRRKPPQDDGPLKTNAIFASPSREGDEAWWRAFEILMETTKEEKADDSR